MILIIIYSIFGPCEKIQDLRWAFHQVDSELALDSLMVDLEESECIQKKAYLASCTMMKAKYVFSPFAKWRYFSEGRDMLEQYLVDYPNDVESRYLRILVQSNSPRFLNYNDELEEDILFVKANLNESGLPLDYKAMILEKIEGVIIED